MSWKRSWTGRLCRDFIERITPVTLGTIDHRPICLFLSKNEPVAVLSAEEHASSTITKYLRQGHFPAISSEPSGESLISVIDDAILDAFDKQPFSSVRELAKLKCILKTKFHRHLTSSLESVVKRLPRVPHELTETQKGQRGSLSNLLLRELRSIKHQGW
jgi:hypothetical protein